MLLISSQEFTIGTIADNHLKLFENFVSIAMKRNHDYKFITLSEYYESIV
jgi:hypothetical protein